MTRTIRTLAHRLGRLANQICPTCGYHYADYEIACPNCIDTD